jgi:pilus assembly protein CpaF
MGISERLKQAGRDANGVDLAPLETPRAPVAGSGRAFGRAAASDGAHRTPIAELQLRAQQALFSRLGARLYDSSISPDQMSRYVQDELAEIVEAEQIPLDADERRLLVARISESVLGLGPIQEFLDDPAVTEVMVTGDGPIYVERRGTIEETSSHFVSVEHLRRVIERIVSQVGRRIDEASPMVDARLADGSRVNAVVPPLTVDGPVLTIRKFSRDPLSIDDLIGSQTLTPRSAAFLQACVSGRVSLLISGGTGSGKTTLLNVLSSFIGSRERIVTIEDSVELQLRQRHVIRMEGRPPNIEGRGEVTIRDLVRNALRMRPDRIIVGEVRGAEALDMLQAMNTGHEGSLTTLHANAPRDALARIETMVLMAGMDLPLRAIREQVASAVDLVVHTARLSDGTRRVTKICEVTGMEGDVIQLSDIYDFDYSPGRDADGRFKGTIEPTGLRPSFDRHLLDLGIELPTDLFGDPNRPRAKTASRR